MVAIRTNAKTVSAILSRTDLKKDLSGPVPSGLDLLDGGYRVVQNGADVQICWVQTSRVQTAREAFLVMRDTLSPWGYKISVENDPSVTPCFSVVKTDGVSADSVNRVLAKSCYAYGPSQSGYYVESFPGDDRFVRVSFRFHPHTTFEGDEKTSIFNTLGHYAVDLRAADYATWRSDSSVLVGVGGNRYWPTEVVPATTPDAMAELRAAVEAADLDYYTRTTPSRNSLFVIRTLRQGIRRTEVFYNEETGEYHATPRFSSFGAVRSHDLTKVVEFLRDELGD